MLHKNVLPESFDFGMPSVELIGTYSGGLHKEAMEKRASAFEDVIADLKPKKGHEYLHVITTGAFEKYGSNRNGDAWNGDSFEHEAPFPEEGCPKVIVLDSGLSKYHDDSYMKNGAVYQEHKTKRNGVDPSGFIVAARYNKDMQRGELIIAVDAKKWEPRLQRKAKGQDIFLSIGADVPRDLCSICHKSAHTMNEHCDHFKKHRLRVYDSGDVSCVFNDTPSFYDISGVDVPADKIAFVLNKVASGEMTSKQASVEAISAYGFRRPMLLTKAALMLDKLSNMEKEIACVAPGDDEVFSEHAGDAEKKKDFLLRVEKYPCDEVISSCNRKGILLTPDMLFALLGKEDPTGGILDIAGDTNFDCSHLCEEAAEDDCFRDELLDGAFDQVLPQDLTLDEILDSVVGDFGVTVPAVNARIIKITIHGTPAKVQNEKSQICKMATFKEVENALKHTYTRYLIGFAAQNNDDTCRLALRKLAALQ